MAEDEGPRLDLDCLPDDLIALLRRAHGVRCGRSLRAACLPSPNGLDQSPARRAASQERRGVVPRLRADRRSSRARRRAAHRARRQCRSFAPRRRCSSALRRAARATAAILYADSRALSRAAAGGRGSRRLRRHHRQSQLRQAAGAARPRRTTPSADLCLPHRASRLPARQHHRRAGTPRRPISKAVRGRAWSRRRARAPRPIASPTPRCWSITRGTARPTGRRRETYLVARRHRALSRGDRRLQAVDALRQSRRGSTPSRCWFCSRRTSAGTTAPCAAAQPARDDAQHRAAAGAAAVADRAGRRRTGGSAR